MLPMTITENLMYSTIRIQHKNSLGTAFFYEFDAGKDKVIPLIITNQHVINYEQKGRVKFNMHMRTEKGIEKVDVEYDTEWIMHPTQDLCATLAGPLIKAFNKPNKQLFYVPVADNIIWDSKKLETLSAVEDVLMVGYPTGLWNEDNNLPLFRQGITANHPAVHFKNSSIRQDNIGVVDMACFEGSSGSPIFILNENVVREKGGGISIGNPVFMFLGILSSGPIMHADGEIEVVTIPTSKKQISKTEIMINLGYYIWGLELLWFKKKISEMF